MDTREFWIDNMLRIAEPVLRSPAGGTQGRDIPLRCPPVLPDEAAELKRRLNMKNALGGPTVEGIFYCLCLGLRLSSRICGSGLGRFCCFGR